MKNLSILILTVALFSISNYSRAGTNVFLEDSVENNISAFNTINDANEILIDLSNSNRKRLKKAFHLANTVTLYQCKTLSLQIILGVAGGECVGIELTREGQVKVQKYIKTSAQIGPGIEASQIVDIEVFLGELAKYSGQIDVFSNVAVILGIGIKHINGDTREGSDQVFFDGQFVRGFAHTWITAQGGLTFPHGKVVKLKLKEDFLKTIIN